MPGLRQRHRLRHLPDLRGPGSRHRRDLRRDRRGRPLGAGTRPRLSRPLPCARRQLSALDEVGPEDLRIPQLIARIAEEGITEVILALSATVEGQTTAHYIAEALAPTGVAVTGLAQGVPIGGELDYLDDGTITAALRARRKL